VTQANFIASERDLIRQMGVDVIRAMNSVAYMIGLLVIGLTIYTATLERSREYGVLKAIGARTPQLVRVVVAQALVAAGLGYLVGVGLAYGISIVVSRLAPDIPILIQPLQLLREVPVLAFITALAALLPVGRWLAWTRWKLSERRRWIVNMRYILEMQQVSKTYGSGHTAVKAIDGVDLSVKPGEIVLVMGPSGSGKTTLLSMAGLLLRPSEGRIWINGQEATALTEHQLPALRLRSVGFVFQAYNLLGALSARENVELVMHIAGRNGQKAHTRAEELLTMLGLEHRLNHLPADLSGGEKQRVALARGIGKRSPAHSGG